MSIKSDFTKNILTLITGTTIAQAIPIVISPILTRLYTPEDFGIFALYISIVSILSIIINARYEFAIILPKKDKYAINIAVLSLIVATVLSFALFVIIFLFHNEIVNFLDNPKINIWLYLIPINVFLIGVFNILNYYNNRKKYYKDLAKVTVIKSATLALIQVIIGFIKKGALGLIVGQILSQLTANYRLFKNIIKDKKIVSYISKRRIVFVGKKYKDFPLHNAPAALADTIALYLPMLVLAKIYDNILLGFYYMAVKIVFLPSVLISRSFSQVFFQSISERKNNNELCTPFFFKIFKKLFLVALIFAFAIYFLSPFAFPIIFGEEWKVSGEIAKYLAIVFFVRFVTSPISSILSVSGSLKQGALWKYLYLLSNIIFFLAIYKYKVEFFDFLFYFIWLDIMLYFAYFILIIQALKKMDRKIKEK